MPTVEYTKSYATSTLRYTSRWSGGSFRMTSWTPSTPAFSIMLTHRIDPTHWRGSSYMLPSTSLGRRTWHILFCKLSCFVRSSTQDDGTHVSQRKRASFFRQECTAYVVECLANNGIGEHGVLLETESGSLQVSLLRNVQGGKIHLVQKYETLAQRHTGKHCIFGIGFVAKDECVATKSTAHVNQGCHKMLFSAKTNDGRALIKSARFIPVTTGMRNRESSLPSAVSFDF